MRSGVAIMGFNPLYMGIGCLVYQAESKRVTTNYLSGCMENNGHRSSSVQEARE